MRDPGYDLFDTPARCRCPVHPPCGPTRRRRDLQRLVRESILREMVPLGVCRDWDEILPGIPAEFIDLIEHLASSSADDQSGTQSSSDKKPGAESKDDSSVKAGDEQRCCRSPGDVSCQKAASPQSSEKVTTDKDHPSSSAAAEGKTLSLTTTVAKPLEKPFSMSVQIGDYEPENVNVSVDGRKVTVKARRDHRDDNGGLLRHSAIEYRFIVPENTDTESLTSSYGTDGTLSITVKRKSDSKEAAIEQATEQRPEQKTEVISESEADGKGEGSQDKAVEENGKKVEVEVDVHQEPQ